MLTMAENSLRETQRQQHLFRNLFVRGIKMVMDAISKDLSNLKKDLTRRQIKVWDDMNQDDVIYVRYLCRGYEDQFGVTREVLRTEIAKRFGQYIDRILKPLMNN